jgi:hypothetical protein
MARVSAPTIGLATKEYEAWLRKQTAVVERDLRWKHEAMAASPLAFLRATYYRWAQRWPIECRALSGAPMIQAIGDSHVENFGTWRDAEGRLAWGVNDFDETAVLPYTNDLIRLATSAALAWKDGRLRLEPKAQCKHFLSGYRVRLADGARPIVLAEKHGELGESVLRHPIDAPRFWNEKLGRDLRPTPVASTQCRRVLNRALPPGARILAVRARVAGLGSLGRARFVAVAEWMGGRIARETKALVPAATVWAHGETPTERPDHILESFLPAVPRSPDPFLAISRGWIVRRLAPDSDKIRIEKVDARDREAELLELMGQELANVHLGSRPSNARAISRDLDSRDPTWLAKAMRRMVARTEDDFAAWRT